LPALRRRALIGTIFAGHVVWLHLLQDNIFPPATFRKRCAFDLSPDHDVLKHSTSWRLLSREEELMERANGRRVAASLREEKGEAMKLRTIALATAFALSSTFALAQSGGAGGAAGAGGGSSAGGTSASGSTMGSSTNSGTTGSATGSAGSSGSLSTSPNNPMNPSGNTLAPNASPSGSTLTPRGPGSGLSR
jgi:hypothetical protein